MLRLCPRAPPPCCWYCVAPWLWAKRGRASDRLIFYQSHQTPHPQGGGVFFFPEMNHEQARGRPGTYS